MELKYLLCAQNTVVDEKTRNISIYNIIEQLGFPIFPAAMSLTVVGHFTRKATETETPKMDLLILDGGKKEITRQSFNLAFQGKLATRLIGNFQPLILESPGPLSFRIEYKNKILGSWEIAVRKIDERPLITNVPTAAALEGTAKATRSKSRKKRL